MASSYVDCQIVISRLKHLLDTINEAVELRVWVHVEEVSSLQLVGHVQDGLDVVHDKAVVKHRQRRHVPHGFGIA